jgi:RHS repeat-associated protein
MTGLTDTNAVASAYGFDADQNRIAENAVRYVYDGPNVVLEIESSLPKAAYVHGRGIDQPIERIQFIAGVADGRHVYHTDALGNVWAMTDNLEVVAKAYTYEAFGKIRSETGTGLPFPNRYTYTARESIGDSLGFFYYRARVMDPNLGRFTSEDPLGFVDGINLMLYVKNNPMRMTDPSGLAGGTALSLAVEFAIYYLNDNCCKSKTFCEACCAISAAVAMGANVQGLVLDSIESGAVIVGSGGWALVLGIADFIAANIKAIASTYIISEDYQACAASCK